MEDKFAHAAVELELPEDPAQMDMLRGTVRACIVMNTLGIDPRKDPESLMGILALVSPDKINPLEALVNGGPDALIFRIMSLHPQEPDPLESVRYAQWLIDGIVWAHDIDCIYQLANVLGGRDQRDFVTGLADKYCQLPMMLRTSYGLKVCEQIEHSATLLKDDDVLTMGALTMAHFMAACEGHEPHRASDSNDTKH